MTASLIALAGPVAGLKVALTASDLSIGRDDSNQLVLADGAVSAQHCLLAQINGAFSVRDLDPVNPTFVNGLPAGERPLADGDEIQIGTSLFVMRLGGADESVALEVEEARVMASRLTVMPREEMFAGRHAESSPERAAADLAALIRIGAALGAVHGLVALQRPLLELIADVIPADRAALILGGSPDAAGASAVGWQRGGTAPAAVHVSRPILERAIRDVVGVLDWQHEHSRSVLAAPLVAFDKVLGAIVLEADQPHPPFDAGHLRLLMGIAASAGMAFEHARHVEWLEGENRRLQATLDTAYNMVGDSGAIREIYRRVARVAPIQSTVLIVGESGTGKELVAHAIHRNSPRAGRLFVAINCAAITETLLESELFGHEKGAFTGAIAQKKGKLEIADGGTVFLDEIGEMPMTLQAKLLRVLQEHEFERVGGTRKIRVDFRLIAATNRNLDQMIEAGAFRQDLYYRLNVVSLAMPPLRDRREDIPLLASYFLNKHADKASRRVAGFTPEALACLAAYDWPGNVRELENAVERALVLGSTGVITPDDLPDAVAEATPSPGAPVPLPGGAPPRFHDSVKQAKKDVILRAVDQAKGNLTAAAKLLGLHPNYLHRLITNLQLRSSVKSDR